MSLTSLLLLPLLAVSAFALPFGIQSSVSSGLRLGSASYGSGLYGGDHGNYASGWPYNTYGPSTTNNNILDPTNLLSYASEVVAPYFYPSYPRTVDYARQFPVVGCRNQVPLLLKYGCYPSSGYDYPSYSNDYASSSYDYPSYSNDYPSSSYDSSYYPPYQRGQSRSSWAG